MSAKSPDEIKKGLECCKNLWDCKNMNCPYLGDGCYPKLHEDIKALVQQLQHNNAQLAIDKAKLAAENAEQADRIKQLERDKDDLREERELNDYLRDRVKQLEAERDAAVRDLKDLCGCMACDHAEKDPDSAPCNECTNCNGAVVESKWQWHGVQKEE